VIEINDLMVESPEQIAEDPYGESWLVKVRVDNPDDDLTGTLTADEYQAAVEGED